LKKLSEVIREGIGLGLPQFFGDYSGYIDSGKWPVCGVCVLGLCYRVLTGELPPNDVADDEDQIESWCSHSDVIQEIGSMVGYDLADTRIEFDDKSDFQLNWALAAMNDNRRMTFEEIAQYLEERGY
jgi:hypothetical protein